MKRVTGIGGIFFKAQDTEKMRAWYREHLGIPVSDENYAVFPWQEAEQAEQTQPSEPSGATVWALFPHDTTYFEPSKAPFMINYRVADLDALLEQLRNEGIQVERRQDSEEGRFAWILDPEGNRIELWEPAPGQ